MEIERKFRIRTTPRDLNDYPGEQISQGYVALGGDGLEVRLRRRGETTSLTVKAGTGRARLEEELEIDGERFTRLWPLTEGRRIEKSRRVIATDGRRAIELDEYAGGLDGLMTAEVEFETEDQADAFEPPEWFGAEVTDSDRYKNRRLACEGVPPSPQAQAKPFALRRGEPLAPGIRRVVIAQIDAAIDELAAGKPDLPEAVHSARKRFKRIRASIRLVRDCLGDEIYRAENATFRDLGRQLSVVRDSQVLVETLDELGDRYEPELPPNAFAELRDQLTDDFERAARQLRDDAGTRARSVAALRAARNRVRDWPLEASTPKALAPGLARLHRRARRALRAARKDRSDESLHELRKRAKDVWYAASLMGGAGAGRVKKLASRSERVADLIGDDHDLAVLEARVRRQPEVAGSEDATLLLELIARRRRRLQRRALAAADRAYAPKPKKIARGVRLR